MPHRTAALLAFVALITAPRAQTTWVVDATGAGNFLDLPPAVAAAASGDTILVRAGTYSGAFYASQGLTILGDSSATTLLTGYTMIFNLPAGSQFAMQHFGTAGSWSIDVTQCRGTLLFDDLHLDTTPAPHDYAIRVWHADRLLVNNCYLRGGPAIQIGNSNALLSATQAYGLDARGTGMYPWASVAIEVHSSLLGLSRCDVVGGMGTPSQTYSGSPAITLDFTEASITGIGNLIAGGAMPTGVQRQAAVSATLGTLRYDGARITLLGGIISTGTMFSTDIPSLATGGLGPNRTLGFDLAGTPGTAGVIMLNLVGAAIVSPFGLLWLDPALSGVVVTATIPASGRLTYQLVVPQLSGRGVSVVFQGATLHPWLALSNGVTVLLE
jgi:hypothetical protein